MAIYRQLHVKMWSDSWFRSLNPTQRYLWIYFITNELSSISGIYEITVGRMCFDTGLEQIEIMEALSRFQDDSKVYYDGAVLWVINLRKYHETSSPKVQKRILDDFRQVQDGRVKEHYAHAYGIDYTRPLDLPEGARLVVERATATAAALRESAVKSETPAQPQPYVDEEYPEEVHQIVTALSDRTLGVAEPFSDYVAQRYYDTAVILLGLDADATRVNQFLTWWKETGCWYDPPAPIALKLVPKEYNRWLRQDAYAESSKKTSLVEQARKAVKNE